MSVSSWERFCQALRSWLMPVALPGSRVSRLGRRDVIAAAEYPVEVGQVAEACVAGDRADGAIREPGVAQAPIGEVEDELAEGLRLFLEELVQIAGGDAVAGGDRRPSAWDR